MARLLLALPLLLFNLLVPITAGTLSLSLCVGFKDDEVSLSDSSFGDLGLEIYVIFFPFDLAFRTSFIPWIRSKSYIRL